MMVPGERVLAAVSGGADSIAMVHVLIALGYDVVIAHLDHLTRNGESTEDAAFVETLAKNLGVPFGGAQCAVEADAAECSDSFEQSARKARYRFFEEAAANYGCAVIATGHHADDVAETVLWRMIRGTSVDGIAGIPPVRSLNSSKVVRPLIACSRVEIIEYVSDLGIDFRSDSSNEDRRFLRNRIRHDLIPLLQREYNPNVTEALERLALLARDDAAVVEETLQTFLIECMDESRESLDRERFKAEASAALQRRTIQTFAQGVGIAPTFERTEAARQFIGSGRTGAKFDLGGAVLINTRMKTRFTRDYATQQEVTLHIPGEVNAFGKRFVAQQIEGASPDSLPAYCTPSRQVFDADILGDSISIRGRRDGDRIAPLGMTGTRKLQDYFVDNGTPQDERDHVPIVFADGRIAWIVGGALGAEFAVTEATRNVVELKVTDAAE
jgi:tRNA(Ile)-lysidine synthase